MYVALLSPPDATPVASNQFKRLCFPAPRRQDRWVMGGVIDYDSCIRPLCHRSGVSASAGSSFVNIRACAAATLLCIFSGRQLAVYISGGISTPVISPPLVRLDRWITVTAGSAHSINPKRYLNHVKCHKQEEFTISFHAGDDRNTCQVVFFSPYVAAEVLGLKNDCIVFKMMSYEIMKIAHFEFVML